MKIFIPYLQVFLFLSISINGICQVNGRVLSSPVFKSTNSDKARKLYDEGVKYFAKNDFNKAVELYRKALEEDSDFMDACDNLGLSFRHLNMLDSAEHYYLISYYKNPKGITVILDLAVLEETKQNLKGALAYYKKINEVDPDDPEGYYGVCRMENELKNYSNAYTNGKLAEKLYKKINSPYIGDCYYVLCLVCFHKNDMLSAKEYLRLSKLAKIEIDENIEKEINKN